MQSGILTDTFSAARVAAMADDDWRRQAQHFVEPDLSRNIALRDALRPIACRHDVTVSAIAVAWTLAWPGVTGAIVGARDAAQVDGWVGASGLRLSPEDLAEISAALRATGPAPDRPRRSGGRRQGRRRHGHLAAATMTALAPVLITAVRASAVEAIEMVTIVVGVGSRSAPTPAR